MKITAQELNRSTLARQLLLRREPLGVAEAVRRVVALQAQQAASPYLALWNRTTDFDPAALDAAFTGYEVVKATLMRITLHAVHADDHRTFREAVEPTLRGGRLDSRFTATGLTIDDADVLVPALLGHADRPRTAAELEAWLGERLGAPPGPGAWRGLRGYAPLLHVPTGTPWSFGPRPSYVAAGSWSGLRDKEASGAALARLIVRYLEGFGPASVADMAQFALVQRGRVREALKVLAGGLDVLAGPDGVELYDVPGAPRPDGDTPAPPRLMAMWDSTLLAYADRSRILPPDYRRLAIRINGDVLPTLLVDGYVAGVWRPVAEGIEARAFHPLTEETWAGLAAEARSLTALLAGREAGVYSRYGHWWAKLPPSAEVRVLPGA
ncbi:winged helix DNA-binding domain-containing protein [Streptomyces niveus]|uniref:winged helix DNA-binding domain-containing protein n=1 Tax=Streptomyces niveus TaxID=193462 RepID=UPI002E328C60|nr:winged helix DNA-binding domain-containing protein [Streptomyces niveus]WTA57086.1 winged helix DNA-binding domain-containing protein [Streptomyces niveus]